MYQINFLNSYGKVFNINSFKKIREIMLKGEIYDLESISTKQAKITDVKGWGIFHA